MQKFIQSLPNAWLRNQLNRIAYLKSGVWMSQHISFNGAHIYKIGEYYLPAPILSWFVTFDSIQKKTKRNCFREYQPKAGDTVVDVGAGLGEEILVASKLVGPTGKVYAIEANPKVFEILQKVIQLNKLDNVTAVNIAISTKPEILKLHVNPESYFSGSVTTSLEKNIETFNIQAVTINQFFKQFHIDKVHLLKSNIEGAERFIIENLEQELPDIENMAIACHDRKWEQTNDEFFKTKALTANFLTKHNYQVIYNTSTVAISDNDWVYGIRKK